MKTKREVVRLEAISRSPMMTCVAGLVRGAPEIRILKKQRYVTEEFIDRLEDNIKNNILMYGLDAWYMNQINICNVFLIQIPGFLIISYFLFMQEGAMSLAKIVLFVLRSQDISTSLTQMLLSFSQLETQMVSIERCSNFSKIEPEPRYLNFELHEKKYLHPTGKNVVQQILRELEAKETSIIPTGKVFFSNVTAKYLSKPKPVLNRLNMQIAPGEKIGIVGRTGAGKTSLIKLFWMCLEPSEGKVILDDKDAMKVDLKVLRSNLDVISQETAIFEGIDFPSIQGAVKRIFGRIEQHEREVGFWDVDPTIFVPNYA
jgi:ABC-type multidrug transport system fused ATPase/permease subunit